MRSIKLFLLFFLIININFSYAQVERLTQREKMAKLDSILKTKEREVIGHFIREKNDEKVDIYNMKSREETLGWGFTADYALGGQFFYYHNKEGKVKKIGQRKIKELFAGDDYYTKLKIGSSLGIERLHRHVVQNDRYILTEYFFNGAFLYYLFNKKTEKFVFKKEGASKNAQKDKVFFNKYIKRYFKNCPEFLEMVKYNLSKDYITDYSETSRSPMLFLSITNYSCD